jgi:hypothetical protein
VLTNLLGNAVKFTPQGGRITLSARAEGESVEIAVTDSGIGIPREDQQRVFERFYQTEDTLTRRTKGSGLGLSIARDLVKSHGSDLMLESESGRGSRFFFHLPVSSERAIEMSEFEEEIRQHRRYPFFGLLVIEPVLERSDVSPEASAREVAVLDQLGELLRTALPRESDIITVQMALRRFVLVMLGTPRHGCRIVRERLEKRLATAPATQGDGLPAVQFSGPACFPDDGQSGRDLIASAKRTEAEESIDGEVQDSGRG